MAKRLVAENKNCSIRVWEIADHLGIIKITDVRDEKTGNWVTISTIETPINEVR